ncbi:MAG: PQQ-dependent sugar dehydrogenase [Pyrinomonadaceae bacterium]
MTKILTQKRGRMAGGAFTVVLAMGLFLTALTLESKSHFASPKSNVAGSLPEDKSARREASAALTSEAKVRLDQLTSRLPLSFEANQGQADQRVKFLCRTGGYSLFLTSAEAVIGSAQGRSGMTLKLRGANPNAGVKGIEQLPERRNYLIGNNPSKWQTDVPTFRKVVYDEIYPGIRLTYYGNQKQLEYDFELAPGADSRAIRLAFDAHVRPRISVEGDLVLQTASGELRQQEPVVYQEINGQRRLIEGRYALRGKREVGFEIGSYDRTVPLVIDPTLAYSTYLGGSGDDSGSSIVLDSANNIYISGTTSSVNFPVKNSAFSNNAGLSDIFVTKIDAAGANIIYSTYVGGSGLDRGNDLALDASGNAYVVGRVDSTSLNFPTTPGAFTTTYGGGDFDGVVFKLNAAGNSLVYSMFLGAEENDSTEGIAVDANGTAYVTGGTKSIGFPTTTSAYQAARAGDTDAYMTAINAAGSGLVYSTLLGGGATDRGSGVAVDANGNAYVVGFAASPDFPTQNAFQGFSGGSFDAFIARVDTHSTGANSLVFSTYFGGVADEKGYDIELGNSASNVYVVGQTSSNNLPVLNPAQPATGGSFDAFIAKLSNSGGEIYATYLGGSGDDRGTGIAVNSGGEVYVTGVTSSSNFPTASPLQSTKGGGNDAFVAKLNGAGSVFLYSTYLGGSGNENSVSSVTSTNPIVLDASSNAYITGYTASPNFPTSSPLQASNGGGASDAFIVKISDANPAADFSLTATPPSQTVNPGNSTQYNVTVTPAGGFTGNVTLSVSGLSSDASSSSSPPTISVIDSNPQTSVLTVTTTAGTPPGTYPLTITGTSGAIQHGTPVSLVVAGPTSANLSITDTASPNPAIVGATLTYRIIVINSGPSPATNVTMTDPLPAGVTFVSATPTQGTCLVTTTVTCSLGSLATGNSATVNIAVVPQSTAQLTNTATVNASETDPDTSNNSSTIVTNVTTQASGPSMLDSNLSVQTVINGLSQPTSMAFIGKNDFLVLEKDTGRVKRVLNGALQSTVLDLAVNSASERGLLGIALHPNFANTGFVYLYWTESNTGADSSILADVPLLGNSVDRFVWNGSTLAFDRNMIKLRAYQADPGQPLRGNHNGGVIRFGLDGKLYLIIGDNGRRGLLQNITSGGPVPDDQYGGPEPDNAHLTGVIIRLNDDGTTPGDNPFFNANTGLTGEAAANAKKIYAYGVRNSFGMAFDPLSTNLWTEENGDDAFDEINRVGPGFNGGWIQVIGPVNRIAQYKQIETTYGLGTLQQLRWPPSLIADTPAAAMSRLYNLPGSQYTDPEFSWKYAVAPSPIGFLRGRAFGAQYEGDLFVGASRTFLSGGYLFRMKLTPDRQHLLFTDSRLSDLVADNLDKFDIAESESLLIGRDFGITTDIQTGTNGNLFVVSNTNGAVYEISGAPPSLFVATLNGAQEVPPTNSTATGTATILLNSDQTTARVSLNFSGLSSAETAAHIHGPAAAGSNAAILFPLPLGQFSDFQINLTPSQVSDLQNGLWYANVHSNTFGNGEIRGQFQSSAAAGSMQFSASSFSVNEGGGGATISVSRIGNTSNPATVDYRTSDGSATNRTDYITSAGTLPFAAGQTLKTFTIPLVDDVYVEGPETVKVILSNPGSGTFVASPGAVTLTIIDNDITPAMSNPLDDAQFFVRQHYLDFLNREPDPGGLAYWTNEITKCGSDVACVNDQRISVSASFFFSLEFQQTGNFVFGLYKGTLGRQPNYSEFTLDRSKLIGGSNLPALKTSLLSDFIGRPEFTSRYPANLAQASFIDPLLQTVKDSSGVDLTTLRSGLIQEWDNCAASAPSLQTCRALTIDHVINEPAFTQAVFNESFVLMEYFGYLRRNTDPGGYLFWLDVLNNREPNNYRGMVCSFITSAEYQLRFSPVITRTNAECSGVH